jgi:hypothetical protein
MYEELNNVFPNQFWFYEVMGLNINDAMDRCARMLGSEGYVVNYQNKIILASVHEIGSGNPWLNLIGGPPIEVEATIVENSGQESN